MATKVKKHNKANRVIELESRLAETVKQRDEQARRVNKLLDQQHEIETLLSQESAKRRDAARELDRNVRWLRTLLDLLSEKQSNDGKILAQELRVVYDSEKKDWKARWSTPTSDNVPE